jgi:hypothetical protein
MQQSSWEERPADQEINIALQAPKVQRCVHNSLTLVPILSQMNAIHCLSPDICSGKVQILCLGDAVTEGNFIHEDK